MRRGQGETKKVAAPVFGPLTFCTVAGAAAGFVPASLRAAVRGYTWDSHYSIDQTCIAVLCGAVLGTVVGVIVDVVPKARAFVARRLLGLWVVLIVGFALYTLFLPAVQSARG